VEIVIKTNKALHSFRRSSYSGKLFIDRYAWNWKWTGSIHS